MLAIPTDTPVTTPVVAPIVAIAGLLLVHMPPGTALVSVMESPTHTEQVVPAEPQTIGPGTGLTTTVADPIVVWHPNAFVATTVYVQGAVCSPKLMPAPVPATGGPTGVTPHIS